VPADGDPSFGVPFVLPEMPLSFLISDVPRDAPEDVDDDDDAVALFTLLVVDATSEKVVGAAVLELVVELQLELLLEEDEMEDAVGFAVDVFPFDPPEDGVPWELELEVEDVPCFSGGKR